MGGNDGVEGQVKAWKVNIGNRDGRWAEREITGHLRIVMIILQTSIYTNAPDQHVDLCRQRGITVEGATASGTQNPPALLLILGSVVELWHVHDNFSFLG